MRVFALQSQAGAAAGDHWQNNTGYVRPAIKVLCNSQNKTRIRFSIPKMTIAFILYSVTFSFLHLFSSIFKELAQGRSYWNRLRFLDLCDIAIDLFSKSYFCKHFLIQALDLVNDPVANVR